MKNKNAFALYGMLLCVFGIFYYWVVSVAGQLGVNYDEAISCFNAMDMLERFGQGDFSHLHPSNWMIFRYAGRVKEFMLVPFFCVFEGGAFAMRAVWGFYAVCTLCFMFFSLRRLFGVYQAFAASCLLAFNAPFIRAVRLNAFREEPFMLLWFWAGVFCFLRFVDSRKNTWLWLAFFLFGIGFWTKVMFAGYIVGMLVVAAVFYRHWAHLRTKNGAVAWGGAFCAFGVGMLPFWVGHMYLRSGALEFVRKAFDGAGRSGHNNFDVFTNLAQRFADLKDLLCANLLLEHFKTGVMDWGWLVLFVVAVVFFLVRFFVRRDEKARMIAAFLLFYSVVFSLSVLVPEKHSPDQLLVLLPLPEIIIGCFAVQMFEQRRKVASLLCAGVLVFHVGIQQYTLLKLNRAVQGREMYQDFSAVVSDSCEYIFSIGMEEKVICLSSWVFPRVEVVTNGGIRTLMPWFVSRREYEQAGQTRLEVFFDHFLKGRKDFCLMAMSPYDEELDGFLALLENNGFEVTLLAEFDYPNCVNGSRIFKVVGSLN